MSKQYDSEGFMSTPLEGSGARPKDDYHPDSEDNEVRFREADEEINASKLISLELLELDVWILTLGAIPQGVLHRSVDSRRDVLRTYQSSKSPLSTPRMLSSGSTKLRLSSLFTRSMMMMRGTA